MKITPRRYTYLDFVEFNIYADLKTALKPDDRIVLNSTQEYSVVIETLQEIDIPHIARSKREILIFPAS